MPSEFELIRRHFDRPPRHTDLAVGDDAALMRPGEGMQLAVSTDMLVAGTHFFADTAPGDLGWKTLAVNVSDLAAMAARPRWVTLALSLPAADEDWIAAFAAGFFECADEFGIDLAGGDTTRGPLNLCPTIFGELPFGEAVTRAGARPGDELWVTGQPGRAALALAHLRDGLPLDAACRAEFLAALHRPQPRLATGLALRGIASAMLDVSDGLLGDLAHILERSAVGAELRAEWLPLAALQAAGPPPERALEALLHGGDDYELLFTAPAAKHARILEIGRRTGVAMQRIGEIGVATGSVALRHADGRRQALATGGYDHFLVKPSRPAQ